MKKDKDELSGLCEFKDASFSIYSKMLFFLYRFKVARPIVKRLTHYLEGGQFYSGTLRKILAHYHGIVVGEYSYGACLLPGLWPSGVTVGRYVSVALNVRVFLKNHPIERLSMHPFFYNKASGFLDADNISSGYLEIGADAWIGGNVIITPRCSRIGIGSVIGAGSVVTKDVPNFAIVAGNPAKLIRYRFNEEICKKIINSKWWVLSVDECCQHMSSMICALDEDVGLHSLLRKK